MTDRPHRSRSNWDGIPALVDDEDTGAIEDPDARQVIRRRRLTPDRIEKLETKMDIVIPALAKQGGQLDTLVRLAEASDLERQRRVAAEIAERDRLEQVDQAKRDAKWKHLPSVIKAIGVAVGLAGAAIIGALLR